MCSGTSLLLCFYGGGGVKALLKKSWDICFVMDGINLSAAECSRFRRVLFTQCITYGIHCHKMDVMTTWLDGSVNRFRQTHGGQVY